MNSELGKRVITGVLGGLFLLALIIWGGWIGIFFITAVVAMAMTHEYATIVYSLDDRTEKRYALLCAAWFELLGSLLAPRSEFEALILAFCAYFAYFLFTAGRHASDASSLKTHFNEAAVSVFGLVYLTLLFLFLPRIHQSVNGIQWTIVFLLIVFSGDTGAYFAGKKFGRTKLYPAVSPKKTREGAAGGIALGYVMVLFSKAVFFREMPWGAVAVLPVIVGSMAQIGDFCESLVKRAYGVKDSGSILPGHGGFLDRFDGVVFSLPVMYACVRFFS
jgi:phosphatidate cytidylyltransferase